MRTGLSVSALYDGPSADVTEDVLNMIYAGKIPDEVEEA